MGGPAHPWLGGSRRYTIEAPIGRGSVGEVFAVFDHQRKRRVALKTLRIREPLLLFRFKQEFRALADVSHRNLIELYELASEDSHWFFTMELIDGCDFLARVRPDDPKPDPSDASVFRTLLGSNALTIDTNVSLSVTSTDKNLEPRSLNRPTTTPSYDEPRLRDALGQLVRGLIALHESGKLHRDIKPSNVLIDALGRVVIVDFGLVTDRDHGSVELGGARRVCGTVGYMSPEQSVAHALGPATDWYSVGVILFEALTGQLPFKGTVDEVLAAKRSRRAPSPRSLVRGLPDDLAALCERLLARRANARPTGDEILEALGAPPPLPRAPGTTPPALQGPLRLPSPPPVFVGRKEELARLHRDLDATRLGECRATIVCGPSGIGKSVLMHDFLHGAATNKDALVFAGRCHERETVPFKAVDAVVDAICHHLAQRPVASVERMIPADSAALAKLFPVLRRVPTIAARAQDEILDGQELRQAGFEALRQLLTRLAERQPIILCVDDLQWSDADSILLLTALLSSPDPPPILLLGSEQTGSGGERFVERLRAGGPAAPPERLQTLELDRLSDADAEALAARLIRDPKIRARARSLVAESEGHPLFICQLAQHAEETQLNEPMISLGDVFAHRIERLSTPAHRLLDVVVVAGRPIRFEVAARAAGAAPDQGMIWRMRDRSLLRVLHPEPGRVELEPHHQGIREYVLARLDATKRREIHEAIARALETLAPDDPERLTGHWRAADVPERAAQYAERAAAIAFAAFAFERAAELYAFILDAGVSKHPRADRIRLADALANAGRSADAADAYLAAGALGSELDAHKMRRLAAEQLLRGGHVDRGVRILEGVLRDLGVGPRASTATTAVHVLLLRAKIAMRGRDYVRREESTVDETALAQIDACWSGALGLGMVDVIRSVAYHAHHFSLALDSGEPYRVSRAFVGEAVRLASRGERDSTEARALASQAVRIAESIDHPHALGLAKMALAMSESLSGRWTSARPHFREAEHLFSRRCTGVTWELATTRQLHDWATAYLGEVSVLQQSVFRRYEEAHQRGDLYASALAVSGLGSLAWIANDDLETVERLVEDAIARWSFRGFHLQHYNTLLAQAHIDLYRGQPHVAEARLKAAWPALRRSGLLLVQQVRLEARYLRGQVRVATGAVESGRAQRRYLARARRDANTLRGSRAPWALPLADILAGSIAHVEGDSTRAEQRLHASAQALAATKTHLYLRPVQLRLAGLRPDGGADVGRVLSLMKNEGIRRPWRFARMLVPAIGAQHGIEDGG